MAHNTVYHGLNIRWGINETTSSQFNASSVILSIDAERKQDENEVKNQYGSTTAWVGFDLKKEGTFEYVASDGGGTPNGNATVTQPTQGDFITVVSDEDNFSGSKWVVKNVTEKALNNDATKVTVRATLYPLIQGS
jgi:hypothetical protein